MKLLKTLRNTSGNSLAEFAVVIALMAVLASTGQVKFSQAGEGGKGKKSGEELDKMLKAANNFYNAMNDKEGAGRFPGQDKWDKNVPLGGGYSSISEALSAVEEWDSYLDAASAGASTKWCSVFGKSLSLQGKATMHTDHRSKIAADDASSTGDNATNAGDVDFKSYIDPVASPYLDGHFIYTVVGGSTDQSPAIIMTDFFNPSEVYVTAQP